MQQDRRCFTHCYIVFQGNRPPSRSAQDHCVRPRRQVRELLLGIKQLFSTAYHPQTDGQTEVVNRSLSTLLRVLIKPYLKNWEECIPHAEFAYNRAIHRATKRTPFEIVYGYNPYTALDMLPLPLSEQANMNFDKRADYMKKLHEDTRDTLEKHNQEHAMKMNKNKRPMIFEEGDLVWLHLRKDRFPEARKTKLHPRGDGPFKILKRINDNAYKVDISNSRHLVHDTFNVKDLSPYHGTSSDEDTQESRTTLSQEGGDDVVRPTHDMTTGPMTRARVKALHDKVNSLLALCDLDTPLNGLLLQSDALCVLRYDGPEDLWGSADQDEQGDAGEEDMQAGLVVPAQPRPPSGQASPASLPGLSPASSRPAHVPERPASQPGPGPASPRPADAQMRPASQAGLSPARPAPAPTQPASGRPQPGLA